MVGSLLWPHRYYSESLKFVVTTSVYAKISDTDAELDYKFWKLTPEQELKTGGGRRRLHYRSSVPKTCSNNRERLTADRRSVDENKPVYH